MRYPGHRIVRRRFVVAGQKAGLFRSMFIETGAIVVLRIFATRSTRRMPMPFEFFGNFRPRIRTPRRIFGVVVAAEGFIRSGARRFHEFAIESFGRSQAPGPLPSGTRIVGRGFVVQIRIRERFPSFFLFMLFVPFVPFGLRGAVQFFDRRRRQTFLFDSQNQRRL